MKEVKKLRLPSGRSIPSLGQGTAGMGTDISKRNTEVTALKIGIDLGMSLIDTAELYGNGEAEKLVGEAIRNQRKEVFLVSKVLPQHASYKGTIEACEKSLQRLGTDYLDLYLLHWKGTYPLEETFKAFQFLKQEGKILDFGVSNFDLEEVKIAVNTAKGNTIAINQVLYNLMSRGIEWDLIPWCNTQNIPFMAYSPFGYQSQLLHHPLLKTMAQERHLTAPQLAMRWIFNQKNAVAIPKASTPKHVEENFHALSIELSEEDNQKLDQIFPAPTKKMALEMI